MLSRSACGIVCSILSDIRPWKGLCSRARDLPTHPAKPHTFALPCDFHSKCHIQVMGMQVWVLSPWAGNGMELSQTLDMLWKRHSMSNIDPTEMRQHGCCLCKKTKCSDQQGWHCISTSSCFVCIQAAPSQHGKHPSSPAWKTSFISSRAIPPPEREPAPRDGILWSHQSYLCPLAIQILMDLKETILRKVSHCR